MVCVPIDLVKSRMQAGALSSPVPGIATGLQSTGVLGTIRAIHSLGGVRLFYNGATAAVVRAFPANGALFLGYELAMRAMA
jgi:hypothetical protein